MSDTVLSGASMGAGRSSIESLKAMSGRLGEEVMLRRWKELSADSSDGTVTASGRFHESVMEVCCAGTDSP